MYVHVINICPFDKIRGQRVEAGVVMFVLLLFAAFAGAGEVFAETGSKLPGLLPCLRPQIWTCCGKPTCQT